MFYSIDEEENDAKQRGISFYPHFLLVTLLTALGKVFHYLLPSHALVIIKFNDFHGFCFAS